MSTIYRKGEVLGWGSVAAVHNGWDELLDRPVAIKELKQPFSGNEPFSRAFRTQALRMLDISHRHVLATYAVDSDRNVHSVVRELADETVGNRSFHGPVEPETALKILRAALLGLDALHGRELIHRAVKPENIFLCKDTYKIGDFGLPPQEGAPPVPLRRYRYSAPEEIQTPELVSRESDLYSLGIVIYELILGPLRLEQVLEELLRAAGEHREPGAPGSSRDEIWPRFHVSPLELPPLLDLEPGVPAALSLALRKMTAKDRGFRFATCRQVLASLGAATPELPTGTLSITIPQDSSRSTPDRSWVWIAGGALAVSAILALAIWGLTSRQQPATQNQEPSQQQTAGPGEPPASGTVAPADRLMGLLSHDTGAAIALDPPRPVLALMSPLSFRVTSGRSGYLLLFTLSPDGSITCLYPNPTRPSLPIGSGESFALPSTAERQQGFDLVASPPPGRQLVFLLYSPIPLPSLPVGGDPSSLLREYPAQEFIDWVAKLLRTRREARLTMVEFEVGAAR